MARSRETAHKSTGGCFPYGKLAPRHPTAEVEKQPEEVQQVVGDYPVQVQLGMIEEEHQEIQPQEGIEEDSEEVIFENDGLEEQPQLYDGALLEVDADGDIVIPSAVGEAPEPDVADEDEPVQDAAGNDPYDSGDDSSCSKDNSSDEEDEEEEDEDIDIEGMEDDNSVVANNENNNDNQDDGNNNGNENEGEQGDEHRYRREEYHEHTYIGPDGLFCELLEELMQDIEHSVRPLYITRHYVEPGMRDYYTTEVHFRVTTGQVGRWRTRTIHPSTTHFTSEAAAINDAARRALWSVSNTFRDRI
jgi:hypothetical protein